MPLSFSIIKRDPDLREVVVDITFDSSYATGGESYTEKDLGLLSLDALNVPSASGYLFQPDYANKKIKAYRFDYDAVADGAAIEVAAAVDLSAVTTRVVAKGNPLV